MTNEPANAKDILNDLDQGVVGSERPKVTHIKEEPITMPEWQLEITDGDHLRIDEQPNDGED